MYHCHMECCLTGLQGDLWKPLKELPLLPELTLTFSECARPEEDLLARAGVVFADTRGLDAQALEALRQKENVIFLAEPALAGELAALPEVRDIWPLPMTEELLRFRFRKWREDLRRDCELREAQGFLDAVIDGSPNLIWFKDRNGVYEKANESFCKTAGKTREQIQGQTHDAIWDGGASGLDCAASDRQVLQDRETRHSEETVRAGGEERLLTVCKSPLYDLDGSIMGIVGVAMDVTRERNFEQELLDKNRTLELLFSTLDCGVMCHSLDGKRLVSVNRAALWLLGYESKEELLADGFDLVARSVLDEDKPHLRERILSLTEPGESVGVEYRVRHEDGTLLYILGNIKLIERNGELMYQRFLLDFTAQKLREEARWAAKDREFRYQERSFQIFSAFLADNIDDVYMMLAEDRRKAEFVTPNAERVLGVSRKDLMSDIRKLGRARYLSGEEIGLDNLPPMEAGMSLEAVETERVNPRTGEHRWFRESVYCVALQGKPRIVVYISDRTAERRSQDALREALEMAQVANKAKSTFLSNVSHDIRTPMNAIMGFVALLREEAGNPERVMDYTQKISAASQHLLGLINDALDMNKIESGSAMLSISELNLAQMVDELNTIIRPQAKAKDQTFELFASNLTSEHLLGDKLRINQILINILSNAVKYTPTGGHIEMRVQELPKVDESYSRIRFTISDNGQGMSEDYLKVIFDPFTREEGTMLNKIQGTGLGMAITKNLVDLMGGTIQVDSAPGKGSTFTVELELRIQDLEQDPQFWNRHEIRRMIVADDDEEICLDIVRKMAQTSVVADYATNGRRAVQMIRGAREAGHPYDLMLLDWKMPDLDGLETARLIRKNYPHSIPILFFTAYDWAEIEKEALEVGVVNFLPKPFFMTNFKDAIQRMKKPQKAVKPAAKSVVDGKRVLVVDDIDVNRLILVKILTTLGAVCDGVENGREALEKFEASQPGEYDIIFMDVQMPVMNGYEATRAIRASGHPSAQSVAIIAMTANAFVDDIRNALESGMDAHVSKPVVLDQLKKTIQEVLEKKAEQKA